MAAVAAAVAATEQPKQAAAIAKAAAAAAPSKAGKIVTAVCRAVPNDYRNVAVAVAQVAPTATKDILKAVGTALPELKPGLDQALAGRGGNTVSVAASLDQAAAVVRSSAASATAGPATDPVVAPLAIASRLPNTPAPLARGPAVGPPYIPLSTTPTNVSPGTSGEVPTGGRDYAAP